ncbi:NIL domain-containing protein [Thermodesulfobacterium geofontis OPF15]|uniref:NIL domain-containing protein n=1 Tax=Thermodesulfobacterium geofontis (strain OPF15) TaxID=795359 RepID=F8C523_THEGP|nr:NIL domain-containing protein [Thermodesulfobacterium geofontis]AEH23592.1 NIL domain-containing protein [Thermodesulfobacterium geofontis OPF15]
MIYKKGLYLKFPPDIVDKPIVYKLVKDYDLIFNILKATITPGKEGIMIMELEGTPEKVKNGLEYLKKIGVEVKPLEQQIIKNEEVCIQCGSCTAVCPTSALYVDRESFKILFDPQKCTACEFCVAVCITKAMEVHVESSTQKIL